jgi:hypothetical protein
MDEMRSKGGVYNTVIETPEHQSEKELGNMMMRSGNKLHKDFDME